MTKEILLIKQYSNLLDKYVQEIKTLQDERDEAIKLAKMFYSNSREWKAKYETLQHKINKLHKE